ncbi:hypothetical protein HK101_006401, partial [Irineochytrium annulatum]
MGGSKGRGLLAAALVDDGPEPARRVVVVLFAFAFRPPVRTTCGSLTRGVLFRTEDDADEVVAGGDHVSLASGEKAVCSSTEERAVEAEVEP